MAKDDSSSEGVTFKNNAELRDMSVFVEAENFKLPENWLIRNGHGIDMYSPGVSGGKTVHNVGEGTATLDITIPQDGIYSIWMWYTKWVHNRELILRVEQGSSNGALGNVVGSATFLHPDDKVSNWSYNVQRGETPITLKAGPARLVIEGPEFQGYVGAPIDCILLTRAALKKNPYTGSHPSEQSGMLLTPSGEHIDWHAFSPQCFVRFTISTREAPAVIAHVHSSLHRSPWGNSSPNIADAKGEAVPPLTPSAWGDISQALATGEEQGTIHFTFKGSMSLPSPWHLKLELASRASADTIFKTIEEDWDGDTASYVMPGNVSKYPNQVESISAITERHLALVKSLSLPGGEKDLRPKILCIESDAASPSPRLFAKEAMTLARMGINSMRIQDKACQDAATAGGMDFTKATSIRFIHDIGLTACSFDPELKEKREKTLTDWVESMERTDPVQFQNLRFVKLADEPSTPNNPTHMTTCRFCQEAFRKWLAARGETPQRFGAADWKEVMPVLANPKDGIAKRRLGWLTSVFAQETAPLPYKHATETLQTAFGRPIATRVNFGTECMNGFSTTMSTGNRPNWFEFGRMKATTLPWTEDWMTWNPHLTPFIVDILRSTAPTQSIPLGMYVIWGYNSPLDPNSAALRTMTAVARNVKVINHYWYGPHYASTECAFSEDTQYVKNVAYVDRVLGLADDLLGTAIAPPRKVAILWSQATEQWKPDDAFTVERRMLHYALSMKQIPVDFICEKDLSTRLTEYRALYLPANNLPQECIKPITDWVNGGGTLIVCGGGPDHDEANEPSNSLWTTLGLTGIEMRKDALGYRGECNELAHLKATTSIKNSTEPLTIPVAGYKAVLTGSPNAKVLGTYQEGGAAIIENRLGKGRTVCFGFNPGISLLIAMDAASCKTFWNVFPTNELTLITAPLTDAGVVPPVTTQVGVDAARLDGTNGSVVTLANFTLVPIQKLSVTVRGISKVSKVTSALRGNLPFQKIAETITVELPLDTVDVIKFYR